MSPSARVGGLLQPTGSTRKYKFTCYCGAILKFFHLERQKIPPNSERQIHSVLQSHVWKGSSNQIKSSLVTKGNFPELIQVLFRFSSTHYEDQQDRNDLPPHVGKGALHCPSAKHSTAAFPRRKCP